VSFTKISSEDRKNTAWQALSDIMDPELPVVSLIEMGIVRDVEVDGSSITVRITPTFSGCPALFTMQQAIIARLRESGFDQVTVEIQLSPAWSTDWIAESAREKLQKFGIAPPKVHRGNYEILLENVIPCPYCRSGNTEIRNTFGPTPCRALAYCHNCRQPFEWFKPI
jgi:ring-1,2-phenylacetyl-CoA epoxidase subunit PaaD